MISVKIGLYLFLCSFPLPLLSAFPQSRGIIASWVLGRENHGFAMRKSDTKPSFEAPKMSRLPEALLEILRKAGELIGAW